MKNVEFPQEVRRGSCAVKIYLTPTKGTVLYTLSYYAQGKRHRPTFADYSEARRQAESVATKLAQGDHAVLSLKDQDRHAYLRAVEALRPLNIALDTAVLHFVEAQKFVNGGSLVEAAKFYAENSPAKVQTRSVSEVVDELLKAKQGDGWSQLYLKDLRLRLGRFAKSFRCSISGVTTAQIAEFLGALDVAPRTKINFRRALGTLLNFAKARGYVARSHPGITEIPKAKQTSTAIGIFTPAEMMQLLRAAQPSLIPALVIGAFAGLRSEELKRLDWSEVHLDRRHIDLRAAKSKTNARRLIPISTNLLAWLHLHARKEGPVVSYRNLGNQFLKLAKRAGVRWQRNGLRHSFVSYRVAETKNVQQVSLEAGNSPKMIFAHYLEVVTEGEALKWFRVLPPSSEKVVPLDFVNEAGQPQP